LQGKSALPAIESALIKLIDGLVHAKRPWTESSLTDLNQKTFENE